MLSINYIDEKSLLESISFFNRLSNYNINLIECLISIKTEENTLNFKINNLKNFSSEYESFLCKNSYILSMKKIYMSCNVVSNKFLNFYVYINDDYSFIIKREYRIDTLSDSEIKKYEDLIKSNVLIYVNNLKNINSNVTSISNLYVKNCYINNNYINE